MKLLKQTIALIACNLYRLLRIFPNSDPIMGAMLPFAKQGKWWEAGLFAAISMASFDVITAKVGIWTAVTALTYGALGIAAHFAFARVQKAGILHYLSFGAVGVLVFDLITGPIMSSWMFGMPFEIALAGQIPFTLLHLASASAFIVLATPILDKAIISNPDFEDAKLISVAKAML